MNYNIMNTTNDIPTLVITLGIVLICVIFLSWVLGNLKSSKSHSYRKYITNLYISSFVRDKAKKEQLDLDQEEKNFLTYCRTSERKKFKDLDDRIEQALSEEMEEKILKKE